MKTPSWESASGDLAALLNGSTDLRVFDCYTITLSGGGVLRYSAGDVAVSISGTSWPLGPTLKRGQTKMAPGIEVDTLTVTLSADASVVVNGTPLLQFVAAGGLDGARVQIDRAFMSPSDTSKAGGLLWFAGRVGAVTTDRISAQIEIVSDAELLDVMVPREVYQAPCLNTLFDPQCGLSAAAYTVTCTATSGTDTTKTTFSHALAQAAEYFTLGVIVGLTGANAGIARTVRQHTSGQIIVISAWPVAVTAGETFAIRPGCDGAQSTCSGKFANLTRYRGQPYIPVAEAAA